MQPQRSGLEYASIVRYKSRQVIRWERCKTLKRRLKFCRCLIGFGMYKDMPQLIGRDIEDLDWQRLGLERFLRDDETDHE